MALQDLVKRSDYLFIIHVSLLAIALTTTRLTQIAPIWAWISASLVVFGSALRCFGVKKIDTFSGKNLWIFECGVYAQFSGWSSLTVLALSYPHISPYEALLFLMLMAGIAASATTSVLPIYHIALCSVVILVLPGAIALFTSPVTAMLGIGMISIVYLCFLVFQLRSHYRVYFERNKALIENEYHRRELESQRLKSIQSAKMSSLGEMSGGIAHEINNPLAIISGLAAQIQRKQQNGQLSSEQLAANVEKMIQTVNRIGAIVRGLRSFARDGSQDPFRLTPIKSFVEEAVDLCKERFKSYGIELRISVDDQDLTVKARPVQLSQVLLNLLNNSFYAVKLLKDKWVEVKVFRNANNVMISVMDSGSGISPEIQEKVMEPFFTTKEPGQGTGLGLSISKGIVDDHGGVLRYDSTSKHTRFVVELPVADTDSQRAV